MLKRSTNGLKCVTLWPHMRELLGLMGWVSVFLLATLFQVGADAIGDAQKQIEVQLPVLQKVIEGLEPKAVVSIKGGSLWVVEEGVESERFCYEFHPEGGPYEGGQVRGARPMFFPAASNDKHSVFLMAHEKKERIAASLISIPDEKIHVQVDVSWGVAISGDRLQRLYDLILKEAGSFASGRTLFKAVVLSANPRSLDSRGAIYNSNTPPSYDMGYVLKMNP
jgi:hypothetical protein